MTQHGESGVESPVGKVKLDGSTPMPLEKGLTMARLAELDAYLPGDVSNPHWQENIIGAYQADHAHKDREAERMRVLLTAWAPIVKYVAVALVGGTAIVYRLT